MAPAAMPRRHDFADARHAAYGSLMPLAAVCFRVHPIRRHACVRLPRVDALLMRDARCLF